MQPKEVDGLTVSEIMSRWPATMRLFIDWHLLCVGCPIAPFHTLTDVAFEHGVVRDDLIEALLEVIDRRGIKASRASTRR
jgi:hybrid cluster-associated redox disulfide protein